MTEVISYIEQQINEGAYLIPDHMIAGVKRYVLNGYEPGHFMQAVLSNDLVEACSRADAENAANLHNWVKFMYNYMPRGSWGSPDNYRDWLESVRNS